MLEEAILVGSFLLTAFTFLLVGFLMGRKTYVQPIAKAREEKTKETPPYAENIDEDPYALALTPEERDNVVASL